MKLIVFLLELSVEEHLCRLKVFFPLMVWGFVVLIPVNTTDNELASYQSHESNVTYTNVDRLSIANVHDLSERCVQSFICILRFSRLQ